MFSTLAAVPLSSGYVLITYKSCNDRHKTKNVPQQQLHSHFDKPGHNGFSDFEFTLIDRGNNLSCVRKREMFWQYKLNTFLLNGLNDCEVAVPF